MKIRGLLMKWYSYLICFVLIIFGVLSLIDLTEMFNKQSKEYGSAIIFNKDYTEFAKFDLGIIDFSSVDTVNYTFIQTYGSLEFDGNENDYELSFNSQPFTQVKIYPGRIEATLNLYFDNSSGERIATSNLNFNIEFLSSETRITITTKNENSSISYLYSYMEINGSTLRILKRG